MAFIASLPMSSREYNEVLAVVDGRSKMTRLIPFGPGLHATRPALLVEIHVQRHDELSETIVLDGSLTIMSEVWKSLFSNLGTVLFYHPQTDGQSKIMNCKVEEITRSFVYTDKVQLGWVWCTFPSVIQLTGYCYYNFHTILSQLWILFYYKTQKTCVLTKSSGQRIFAFYTKNHRWRSESR